MAMVLNEREGAVARLALNNPVPCNAPGAGKGFCSGAQFGGGTFSQADAMEDLKEGATAFVETRAPRCTGR